MTGKTRFTQFLIIKNSFHEHGFQNWIFVPGMLFQARDKWWGNRGKREKSHEGLDLCLYQNQQNRILRIHEKTQIPVMYKGTVVKILDDFLGRSVIIKHGFTHSGNRTFCTIYGHIEPDKSLFPGAKLKQGDIIGTVANSGKSKAGIFPHLHISLGWKSESVFYNQLNWNTIGDTDTMILLDPLYFIDSRYQILSKSDSAHSR
jgi:hypothetical protein